MTKLTDKSSEKQIEAAIEYADAANQAGGYGRRAYTEEQWAAVMKLPAQDRAILLAVYNPCATDAEIAKAIGLRSRRYLYLIPAWRAIRGALRQWRPLKTRGQYLRYGRPGQKYKERLGPKDIR